MTCVRCSLITLEKWAQVFAVRRQAAKQFISPTESTHCTIEHLWRGGELRIQTIMWHIDRENHVHNQPKLIGRNTNKMWELMLQVSSSNRIAKRVPSFLLLSSLQTKIKMQFATLFVGWPQPTPTFHYFAISKQRKKEKREKKVVSAEVSVNEFLNLNLPYWFGKFSCLYSSTNFQNNFALQKETIYT